MSLILSGSDGVSDIDGSASTPAIRGTDANTGIFFPAADTIAFAEGGAEAMRIDSSGNVGIGTTSPGARAEIYVTRTSSTNAVALILNDNVTGSQTNGVYKAIRSLSNNGASVSELRFLETDGTNNNTGIAFATSPSASSLTERARITNDGNLLVGTTTNASGTPKVTVNGSIQPSWGQYRVASVFDNDFRMGLYFDSTARNMTIFSTSNDSGGNIIFSTRLAAGSSDADYGTERARITSGGNLGVGTSSPDAGARVTVQASSGNNGMAVKAGTNGNYGIYFNNVANSTVGGIVINSGAVAYNTSSDYRLKENVAPMTGALAKVLELKPVNYTWKVDGSAGQGFIAHELQAVVPDCVSGEKDGEQMQGVDYGKLTPILTAALQEAIAEIQSLKARIAVLEAK